LPESTAGVKLAVPEIIRQKDRIRNDARPLGRIFDDRGFEIKDHERKIERERIGPTAVIAVEFIDVLR
jgi:hypothetical protein